MLPLHRVPSQRSPPSSHQIIHRVENTHFPTAMIAICYAVEMACCGERVVDFVVESELEVFHKSRTFSVCEGHASEASRIVVRA